MVSDEGRRAADAPPRPVVRFVRLFAATSTRSHPRDGAIDRRKGAHEMNGNSLPGMIRAAARTVRWLPDRFLHPSRRRRALHHLRGAPSPSRILMVCHGNICRSPYAERALRARLGRAGLAPTIRSAGFAPPGQTSPDVAIEVAGARGVDLARHRSSQLSVEEVHATDLVVVMEPRQRRDIERWFGRLRRPILVLGDLDPDRVGRRAIADPFGGGADAFDGAFRRIDRCLARLGEVVEELARRDAANASRACTPAG